MSEHAATPAAGHAADSHHEHPNYVRIWMILLVLLVISIIGPMFEIKVLTLITAFGIAVIKAFLVAKHFMHLNVQRPYVIHLLVLSVALMVLLFGAVAPDVMKHEGRNWTNDAAAAQGAAHAQQPADGSGAHGSGGH